MLNACPFSVCLVSLWHNVCIFCKSMMFPVRKIGQCRPPNPLSHRILKKSLLSTIWCGELYAQLFCHSYNLICSIVLPCWKIWQALHDAHSDMTPSKWWRRVTAYNVSRWNTTRHKNELNQSESPLAGFHNITTGSYYKVETSQKEQTL